MHFSVSAVLQVINFVEGVVKHVTDIYDGLPFELAPWQEEWITEVFGNVDDAGNPIVETVYLEVPKKSGKTTLCAVLVLLALVVWKRGSNYQVYSTASSQKQARHVFDVAATMVERSPILKQILEVKKNTSRIVRRDDPTSFYAAIAADGDTQDGFNPAFVIVDELHRWRTRKAQELWDVLTTSGIARARSMVIAITTAGTEGESPIAKRMHDKVLNIAKGLFKDPSFYGRIWGAKPTDDWKDEEVWKRVHPALECNGGHLSLEKLRAKFVAALTSAEERLKFRRYYLNIWGETEEAIIEVAEWERCGETTWQAAPCTRPALTGSLRHPPHEFLKRFVGRPCYLGGDLSLTTDLSALVAVFPNGESLDDGVDVLPFFYAPRGDDGEFGKLAKRTGMPYAEWARDGWIHASEGNAIGTREIQERVRWCREMFDVRANAFDRANSRDVTIGLVEEGIPVVEVQQSYLGMSEASKKVLSLIQTGKFHHGNHPILRWNALSLSVQTDKKDNIIFQKPNRLKNSRRIDGMQAAAIAVAEAIVRKQAGESYLAKPDSELTVI